MRTTSPAASRFAAAPLVLFLLVTPIGCTASAPENSDAACSEAARSADGELLPSPARSETPALPPPPADTAPETPGGLGKDEGGGAEGALPAGTTALDGEYAGIANLDPDLRAAVREASTRAEADGARMEITSGWRSRAYQDRLLQDAIVQYGSEAEAARWVATPECSAHVSGDAVDITPAAAAEWLSRYGAELGLCQTYANEPWHFELRAEAAARGCPEMYADAAADPRARR